MCACARKFVSLIVTGWRFLAFETLALLPWKHPLPLLKHWPNWVTSRSKLKTWVYLRLWLRLYHYQLSQNCLRLLLLWQKSRQDLPSRPSEAVDPFEKFLKEESKRPAQWSSNCLLKKPKAADKKEEAEDIVDWKKQLEEKSAECAALKSQVAELQQNSVSIVEALSKNQETFCKVSITALYERL